MRIILVLFGLLYLISCSSGQIYQTESGGRQIHKKFTTAEAGREQGKIEAKGRTIYMVCSYYGSDFHGKQTSNGEIFDMYKLTCAHKTLPFNTILKVTNEDNMQSVTVRVNDRGPFIHGRDLDLSYEAARQVGLIADGVKKMKVQILE